MDRGSSHSLAPSTTAAAARPPSPSPSATSSAPDHPRQHGPALDVRSSRSPAPFATATKKKAASPAPSKKKVAKKKAVPPVPSATLPPPKFLISMEAPVTEQARLKRSRTEAGQEQCPTSGDETLPHDIQLPDVTSTPTMSQFLSSMPGSKRKRTPRPTSMPEDERAEQGHAREADLDSEGGGAEARQHVPAGVHHGGSRRDTSLQTGTPEIEAVELRGKQYRTPLSRIEGLQANNRPCLPTSTTNDHSNTDSGGYHWGYEGGDLGDSWRGEEEDEDEPTENGGVEEMVDGFLYGEENRQFRSKVWTEFSKVRVGGIVTKGQCIHCNVEISAKRGSGTSAMGNHLKRCKVRQSVMNIENQLKSTVMSPEGVALKEWRFSQDVSRRELNRMISLHRMPFSVVEYDGFRRFVSSLNPAFKMTSRRTITADTMKAFKEQKQALQEALRTANSRVSLTMDMWTSNQTLGYMCITCHFLDADWKMHKRIMKFSVVKTPHTGVALFNVILKAIQEWNIEDKIFAITLDNASNNNAMVKLLKKNLLEKHLLYGTGKLLHQRCAAHVINLICTAGFEVIDPVVQKIRESVKYIHGSQSRMQKFEEIIQQLGISYGKRPKIDTSTRWNSTYLMLDTCYELKKAFESLSEQDLEYPYAPTVEEWEKARLMRELLRTFFDATNVVSGSLYPTANLHFDEIWEVKMALENRAIEENSDLTVTIEYMRRKFNRYWKLTWLQISFPVIFDPRFKFGYIEFRLKKAFGNNADSKIATVKKLLKDLFKEYSQLTVGSEEATQQVADVQLITSTSGRYADWDIHMSLNATSTSELPSELDTYLAKPTIPRSGHFDVLAWWRSNSLEYPILSRMARDILVVPASSVASESAFSIGKRVISDDRSRLAPETVEALVCRQDWIRASSSSKFRMESIHDFIEQPDQHE